MGASLLQKGGNHVGLHSLIFLQNVDMTNLKGKQVYTVKLFYIIPLLLSGMIVTVSFWLKQNREKGKHTLRLPSQRIV